MCSNIELFDEYAAKLFSHLYQTFPVKQQIDILEFFDLGSFDRLNPGQILDESGLADSSAERKAEIAWHTLTWLSETGFVTLERLQPYHTATGVTLTVKGLEVLKSEPSSLKPQKRIGNELIAALKVGNLEVAKELIRQAVRLSIMS